MKNEVIEHVIFTELQKLPFVPHDKLELISNTTTDRIDEQDDETIIRSKIYDVLFFYLSGSHIKNQPFKADDFSLLARRIKVGMEKPEGEIDSLLIQIADLNLNIKEAQNKVSILYDDKKSLIARVQKICPHFQYLEIQEHWSDEYGHECHGDWKRKCLRCCVEEKGITKGREVVFTKIIGTPMRLAWDNKKRYEDFKL